MIGVKRERSSDIMAMVFAALMRGAKTRTQLRESIEVNKVAIDRAIRALRNHGVAYVSERRKNGNRGKPSEVFSLNALPFDNEDAAPAVGRQRKTPRPYTEPSVAQPHAGRRQVEAPGERRPVLDTEGV